MEIRPLDPAAYAGKRFTARYQTAGYYDICAGKDGFHIEHRPFPSPAWLSFDDEFFGEWLEDPVAFGAFEGAARTAGARMLVLETQSCNENAIAFYRKNGFQMIGFDLYAYSNDDPARREVRIEMGKKL